MVTVAGWDCRSSPLAPPVPSWSLSGNGALWHDVNHPQELAEPAAPGASCTAPSGPAVQLSPQSIGCPGNLRHGPPRVQNQQRAIEAAQEIVGRAAAEQSRRARVAQKPLLQPSLLAGVLAKQHEHHDAVHERCADAERFPEEHESTSLLMGGFDLLGGQGFYHRAT